MKKFVFIAICYVTFSCSVIAQPKETKSDFASTYTSPYRKTHNVRSYFRKDGTFVKEHRAGNPHSGVHCHNNICS